MAVEAVEADYTCVTCRGVEACVEVSRPVSRLVSRPVSRLVSRPASLAASRLVEAA